MNDNAAFLNAHLWRVIGRRCTRLANYEDGRPETAKPGWERRESVAYCSSKESAVALATMRKDARVELLEPGWFVKARGWMVA